MSSFQDKYFTNSLKSSLLTAFSLVDMYSVGPEMSYSPNSTNKEANKLKQRHFVQKLH